ncbi:MAG TPA: GatB/YqeY domain-containing protein [Roseiflexaceae bacterium]|mgnify:CR=1 FL=1|nr:GatB/YqeY domain-containing protein [Roseiflexaceae bacterium]HMP39695.1 GatB/YqeY domain-containing protein [Roseiflexaceae bacterium]
MNIQEQLQNDLKSAMRGGDRLRVEVIRMTLAALKNAQMTLVKSNYDALAGQDATAEVALDRDIALTDAMMQETLSKEVKRRREAAELYRKGHRADLAQREDDEAAILEAYLPRQLTLDELRPLVAAVIAELGAGGPGDMNKVMPVLVQRFKGRADGRLLNQAARELLTASP